MVVIDACGAGELPDSGDYGDAGTNTLAHVAEAAGGLELPVLTSLGLGNIMPLAGAPPVDRPVVHGRLHPLGPGKDTVAGHWELMGVVTPVPLRTYPEGFPDDVLDALRAATGRGILCNRPYSGTEVIDDFGEQHLASGELIVYTSADSVLQIAAHEDKVPLAELYEACAAARAIMTGEHAVGRVIARPFRGEPGTFERTEGRRDIALDPPGRSYLDELRAGGVPVHTVGKIGQVFNGVGVDEQHKGSTNAAAIAATGRLIDSVEGGFVFANLVETDQVFGHRNDVEGYARNLEMFDARIPEILGALADDDVFMLTADHGCDPSDTSTDHTREHVPLLVRGARVGAGRDLGVRSTFADLGQTLADNFGLPALAAGTSFLGEL